MEHQSLPEQGLHIRTIDQIHWSLIRFLNVTVPCDKYSLPLWWLIFQLPLQEWTEMSALAFFSWSLTWPTSSWSALHHVSIISNNSISNYIFCPKLFIKYSSLTKCLKPSLPFTSSFNHLSIFVAISSHFWAAIWISGAPLRQFVVLLLWIESPCIPPRFGQFMPL